VGWRILNEFGRQRSISSLKPGSWRGSSLFLFEMAQLHLPLHNIDNNGRHVILKTVKGSMSSFVTECYFAIGTVGKTVAPSVALTGPPSAAPGAHKRYRVLKVAVLRSRIYVTDCDVRAKRQKALRAINFKLYSRPRPSVAPERGQDSPS
jgi:hypothetical protein